MELLRSKLARLNAEIGAMQAHPVEVCAFNRQGALEDTEAEVIL